MRITHVEVHNWRNFKTLDFPIHSRMFVVGPNAAGKSNLLDIFRFLSDLSTPGGGLASAFEQRGGFTKVRSLFARSWKKGRVVFDLSLEDDGVFWQYRLAVKGEAQGRHRVLVAEEIVVRDGVTILSRPDRFDEKDPERLTQTHLEQISANTDFRAVAEYFTKVRYFHPVPQVIRDPTRSGGSDADPYGGDFIAQMNTVQVKTRNAWLRRMEKALQSAVPAFESLSIVVDGTGKPHLTAGYKNWRSNSARQSEEQFSDGTLRLIGLLWTLVSAPANGGILLLEEPGLSPNASIVKTLPGVLATAQRGRSLQVILSTHPPEILDDEGVLADEVLVLRVTKDGTSASLLSDMPEAAAELEAELPKSSTVQALIDPGDLSSLLDVGAGGRR